MSRTDNRAWVVAPRPDATVVETLVRRLRISPVLARVLVQRGLADPDAARAFLYTSLNHLHAPETLPGMADAANRIHRAVLERERILIYGDYDVDGITAAALLWHLLRLAHAEARIYIPHRVEEGYGLNREAIERLAREGVDLIITVDCGITAVEEVAAAAALGIDVIVTDHHEPADRLPEALAVIDPKRPDSAYPFPDLSGVGVAFKLAWSVAQRFSPGRKVSPEMRAFLLDGLALVALGTVADVVPLVGENRVLTHFGLQALTTTPSPGLRALIEASRVQPGSVTGRHVAFQLAPRLNAAGRIGHADLAAELLTTADTARAAAIAAELDALNRRRQQAEQEIVKQAEEAIAALDDLDRRRAIVLADARWHAGIIGIVASRLVGLHHRPVILIAADRTVAQGSGRSIPGFDLFAALTACSDRLISFGGHEQAVGLRLDPADVPWFAERFEATCRDALTDDDLVPRVRIDAEADFDVLIEDLLREFDRLAPFGQGNRRPVLATRGVRVCGQPRRVGSSGKHLVLFLRHGETTRRAIGFDMGERLAEVERDGPVCDVAYRLSADRYRATDGVELVLRDIAFSGPT